jgi:Ca2+-binding EF-hand superfamily protein
MSRLGTASPVCRPTDEVVVRGGWLRKLKAGEWKDRYCQLLRSDTLGEAFLAYRQKPAKRELWRVALHGSTLHSGGAESATASAPSIALQWTIFDRSGEAFSFMAEDALTKQEWLAAIVGVRGGAKLARASTGTAGSGGGTEGSSDSPARVDDDRHRQQQHLAATASRLYDVLVCTAQRHMARDGLELPDARTCRALFDQMVSGVCGWLVGWLADWRGRAFMQDTDRTGTLSAAEFQTGVLLLLPELRNKAARRAAFKLVVDTAGAGQVRRSSFRRLLDYTIFFNGLGKVFDSIDTRRSGRITEDLLVAAFGPVGDGSDGVGLDEPVLRQAFQTIDRESAGSIRFSQLCMWVGAQARAAAHDSTTGTAAAAAAAAAAAGASPSSSAPWRQSPAVPRGGDQECPGADGSPPGAATPRALSPPRPELPEQSSGSRHAESPPAPSSPPSPPPPMAAAWGTDVVAGEQLSGAGLALASARGEKSEVHPAPAARASRVGGPQQQEEVSGRFHILCGRFDWDLPTCCVFLSTRCVFLK